MPKRPRTNSVVGWTLLHLQKDTTWLLIFQPTRRYGAHCFHILRNKQAKNSCFSHHQDRLPIEVLMSFGCLCIFSHVRKTSSKQVGHSFSRSSKCKYKLLSRSSKEVSEVSWNVPVMNSFWHMRNYQRKKKDMIDPLRHQEQAYLLHSSFQKKNKVDLHQSVMHHRREDDSFTTVEQASP